MESRVVTHALMATFSKSKVLLGNKDTRVSCSRMRAAIATEMAVYGEEDFKTFASCFMMHRGDFLYVFNYFPAYFKKIIYSLIIKIKRLTLLYLKYTCSM